MKHLKKKGFWGFFQKLVLKYFSFVYLDSSYKKIHSSGKSKFQKLAI